MMAASSTEDAAEQATADSAAETADTADSGEAEEPETGKKNKLAERITDEEAVALC